MTNKSASSKTISFLSNFSHFSIISTGFLISWRDSNSLSVRNTLISSQIWILYSLSLFLNFPSEPSNFILTLSFLLNL